MTKVPIGIREPISTYVIKQRRYKRLINTGNYENFEAEAIGDDWDEIKKDVEGFISTHQSKILRDALETRLELKEDDLKSAKTHPEKKGDISMLKFKIALLKAELDELKRSDK